MCPLLVTIGPGLFVKGVFRHALGGSKKRCYGSLSLASLCDGAYMVANKPTRMEGSKKGLRKVRAIQMCHLDGLQLVRIIFVKVHVTSWDAAWPSG